MVEMKPIIELIHTNMRMEQEGAVMRAVANVGVNVDKERLVRAIEDARSFWMEGYNEGVKAGRPHGRWVKDTFCKWQCNSCHCPAPSFGYPKKEFERTPYCPNCGEPMDLEEK